MNVSHPFLFVVSEKNQTPDIISRNLLHGFHESP